MTFFTSDSHTYQKNICFGISSWDEKEKNCRKYDTIEKMNYDIFKSINDTVGQDDELYFLGDFSFGGIENIWNTRKQIICKNIHFILGNHDHHIQNNKKLPNCHWDYNVENLIVDGENPKIYGDFRDDYFDVYAHDLFTSVNETKKIIIDKQEIVLCHFPWEQWLNMQTGTWHLFGHVHGKLVETKYKRLDVGLDANNFKILSFDDIKKIMEKRVNKEH